MTGLKELRTEKGLSQMDAARQIGVSLLTYQLWERGITTPNEENLKKLKEVLGVK